MSALTVAQEAHDLASQAKADITAHEQLCAERYKNIEEKLSGISGIIKWAGTTGFVILLGLLGFLAKTQFESVTALQAALVRQSAPAAPPQIIIQRPDTKATVERTGTQ